MTNVEAFINGIKETDFYEEYIDKLYVTEETPDTVYYTLKKNCEFSKVKVALLPFASFDVGFAELLLVDESQLDKSRLREA